MVKWTRQNHIIYCNRDCTIIWFKQCQSYGWCSGAHPLPPCPSCYGSKPPTASPSCRGPIRHRPQPSTCHYLRHQQQMYHSQELDKKKNAWGMVVNPLTGIYIYIYTYTHTHPVYTHICIYIYTHTYLSWKAWWSCKIQHPLLLQGIGLDPTPTGLILQAS